MRERVHRVVALACPVCAKGKPFAGIFEIHEQCSVCRYRFQREPGYFIGSFYFNYGATVGIAIPGYLGLEALFGLTFGEQIGIWLAFAGVFSFWFLRYARSLWMALDLAIAPAEESDFVMRGAQRDEGSRRTRAAPVTCGWVRWQEVDRSRHSPRKKWIRMQEYPFFVHATEVLSTLSKRCSGRQGFGVEAPLGARKSQASIHGCQ
jgi:uncharacterized protein (DUF983 family)